MTKNSSGGSSADTVNEQPDEDEFTKGYNLGWKEAMDAMESHVRHALGAARVIPYYGERKER